MNTFLKYGSKGAIQMRKTEDTTASGLKQRFFLAFSEEMHRIQGVGKN
jgi:hypothetical protein